MKLRPPSIPLFPLDPYFSLWAPGDTLTGQPVAHWTGKPCQLVGEAVLDGQRFRFLGESDAPAMTQQSLSADALSTTAVMEAAGVRLTLFFLTPLLPDDYDLLTRPVGLLEVRAESLDGAGHSVQVSLRASEELCLDHRGQMPVEVTQSVMVTQDAACCDAAVLKMGSKDQPVLSRSGDDLRIDWGWVCLSAKGEQVRLSTCQDAMTWICAEADASAAPVLFALGYDDQESIQYFGKNLRSWWNRDGKTIETAMAEALDGFETVRQRCDDFSTRLFARAVRAGGEHYAELLELAWRQVLAAHKLVLDENGEILYISKECFSNGCAATVDVSYPSMPLFLLFAPELVRGMMRPIFRYAADPWPFDFAPHDAGQYPLLNGQVYSGGTDPKSQMPVEECGNMLLMMTAVTVADGKLDFAREHLPVLKQWAGSLLTHGADPGEQLCTDDFAGHLAHNCNLSLKAIMGLAGLGRLCRMLGEEAEGNRYDKAAREMAAHWQQSAANGDGSYRLAFDQPGSFSMKYNAIWDRVLGFGLFPPEVMASELASCMKRVNPYGMPLDNRETYTKSDWLVWTAALTGDRAVFEAFVEPLWQFYHRTPDRVPMTDWYQTITGRQVQYPTRDGGHVGFQNRTVQGGLFIQLLAAEGTLRK